MNQHAAVLDAPEQEEPGFSEYLAAIKRRRKLLALAVTSVLFVALAITFAWPAKYRSSATILIEQQEIPQDMVRSTITSYADQRVQVISQQVMTTANLLEIIRKYDLYPKMIKTRAREVVLDKMRDDIDMRMISADVVDPRSGRPTQATIAFTLSYRAPNPNLAAKVANELTTLFLNKNLESRERLAGETAEFLADEAARLRTEIEALEVELSDFKARNVDQLPELAQVNMTMMNRSELELREVDRQLRSLTERKIYLEAELLKLAQSDIVFTDDGQRLFGPADRLKFLETQLATLESQYASGHPDIVRAQREISALRASLSEDDSTFSELDDLRAEKDRLLELYTANHPDVIEVERKISAVESGAMLNDAYENDNPAFTQLSAQLAAARADEASLLTLRDELKNRVASFERRLAETPIIEKDYYALTRDLENSRLKYREVQAREMEAKLAQSMESDRKGERLTLIEPPLAPQKPVSPNRTLLIGFGLVASIVVGLGAVAFAESIDTSIKSRKALEQLIGATAIGIIPVIPTEADLGKRRRLKYIAGASACSAGLLFVTLVHFFYVPLDVLWFAALRKMALLL